MQFQIYRDVASIAFVRCVSRIPGSNIHAEGSSFFAGRAIEKCRSEVIESHFQLSHPNGSSMIGIAAHPVESESFKNAWNEALETLVLQQLAMKPVFRGFSVRISDTVLCLGSVNDRFAALALFDHDGVPTLTQAVGTNPIKTLLKAWTEVRNLRLYKPKAANLPNYTKANRILSAIQISRIRVEPFGRNTVSTDELRAFQVKEQTHVITYFT